MKKAILVISVTLMTIALLSTLLIGTVAANRGQTMKQYVEYEMTAVLNNPVYTAVVNFPTLTVSGYRPPSGVQSCVLMLNGEEYSYPEDFDYAETFRIVKNLITNVGTIQVNTTFTFNLPGNPTITEWLSGTVVGTPGASEFDGTFYLTGTKMFTPVEGGGIIDSHGVSGTDYANHIGLIKGWIFD